jgi:hypothetical protein
MTTRKTVTTTHSRYTVDGAASDKLIKLMEAPYEQTVSVCDSETGGEIPPRPDRYEIEGYEALERVPRHYSGQSSATLYLPKEWGNKRVKVVRIDP